MRDVYGVLRARLPMRFKLYNRITGSRKEEKLYYEARIIYTVSWI